MSVFDPVCDHMADGMGLCRLHLPVAAILREEPLQFVQVPVKLSLDHDGLHVVDEDGIAPPLRDGALRRVVRVVDVEIGHGVDGDIGKAAGGEARSLAGEEFEVAVRAHVDHRVGAELPGEPLIGGDVLVGRRHGGVVEDLADLAVASGAGAAPLRLNADHRVPEPQARDQNSAVIDHGSRDAVLLLAGGIAPGPGHPRRVGSGSSSNHSR